ncbi:hypothetical protein Goshw_019702 [Gossypium schwendimanii]|uniref:Calcineurin-like phosphoesterase domain-containing protein n=1 Tax=Gossypium schwendimanii TaxID=34291 RepID=A0A7J9KY54_GOSSC|nr:hypothetical protein [Gossypium schwendimanii]
MGILLVLLLCLITPICFAQHQHQTSFSSRRTVIDVKHGPDSVVWAVQLSDLHFSVHHPQRAIDFRNLVPPALSMINPSLVLITGDLTGNVIPYTRFDIRYGWKMPQEHKRKS